MGSAKSVENRDRVTGLNDQIKCAGLKIFFVHLRQLYREHMKAPLPDNEVERIAALQSYGILDTLPDQEYQDIVHLASVICGVPIAVMSLVDKDRQWFKAKVGIDAEQTERDVAFCAHALSQPDELLIVPDASHDVRFFDNPLVTGGLKIAFYAGAPLRLDNGLVLGTLCVIDREPKLLTEVQKEALQALARQVMGQLERRHELAQLEAAQAQLLQSEKMASIGQLAAGVAHEINNPIGFVTSNIATLRSYTETMIGVIDRYSASMAALELPAEARQKIDALIDQNEWLYLKKDAQDLIDESMDGLGRVKDIVGALRDFSHAGTSVREYADVHASIDNALRIVANTLRDKIDIIKEFGDLKPIRCMPSQLAQVFMNLLVNAAHAMTDKGTVRITTKMDNNWVNVQVADNGQGIAPEHLPHIFEPFFTTKAIGVGTGLGLSVTYNIITAHGGKVSVVSAVGSGTTFTLQLPVDQLNAAD